MVHDGVTPIQEGATPIQMSSGVIQQGLSSLRLCVLLVVQCLRVHHVAAVASRMEEVPGPGVFPTQVVHSVMTEDEYNLFCKLLRKNLLFFMNRV